MELSKQEIDVLPLYSFGEISFIIIKAQIEFVCKNHLFLHNNPVKRAQTVRVSGYLLPGIVQRKKDIGHSYRIFTTKFLLVFIHTVCSSSPVRNYNY